MEGFSKSGWIKLSLLFPLSLLVSSPVRSDAGPKDLLPLNRDVTRENPPDPTLSSMNPIADNSMMNRLNDGKTGLTAEQQSNRPGDVELTRTIRQGIIKKKNLSIYAHNVKIITREGEVTLKGPVRSLNEKQEVEDSAIEIAGPEHVQSELEVTSR